MLLLPRQTLTIPGALCSGTVLTGLPDRVLRTMSTVYAETSWFCRHLAAPAGAPTPNGSLTSNLLKKGHADLPAGPPTTPGRRKRDS